MISHMTVSVDLIDCPMQLIRELKEEVTKLRVVIKAEGLEAKVASFSELTLQCCCVVISIVVVVVVCRWYRQLCGGYGRGRGCSCGEYHSPGEAETSGEADSRVERDLGG